MKNRYRINTLIILLISVILSVIGMIVQAEWGKALFPESVQSELAENILLLFLGILLCGILAAAARFLGSRRTIWIVFILTLLLMILSVSPLALSDYSGQRLYIGPVVVRFGLMAPLVFILAVSSAIDLYGKEKPGKILTISAGLIVLFMLVITICQYGLIDYVTCFFPWIAFFLLLPYMKQHKWYYAIPAALLAVYVGRIILVACLPEGDIYFYRHNVIAGWLHPDNESFFTWSYFMSAVREKLKSGGLFGSSTIPLDIISYREDPGLILVCLLQRFGLAGYLITLILYLEMCRRIFMNGKALAMDGKDYYAALCNGIGCYMVISAVLSTLAYYYILPLATYFQFPFVCIGGFLPMWYLYLAVTLILSGEPGTAA